MDMHEEALKRLAEVGPEKLLQEAVEDMIRGSIEGLMVNLGHGVNCDPALTCSYGDAAFQVAIKAIRSPTN